MLPFLPPNHPLETRTVLRKAAQAHRFLAELKGVAATIPNESILINTLSLQEAKDSSAVENIITTHDELFRAELFGGLAVSPATKEVQHYAAALRKGFELVKARNLLTVNHILAIQRELEQNEAGFRKLPGTALVNQQSGQVVYTPPQHPEEIQALMNNLERVINDEAFFDADPLVKMALIHYQFKSIHPFYDGNGRTGRIINILYLVVQGLLGSPILYLSRYILQHKADYYRLLQAVREENAWEAWTLYMLDAVEQTARQTIELVGQIRRLMQDYKLRLRRELPKLYSQDLLNNLFRHPYTKIEFLVNELGVTRLTAARYLDLLVEKGFLQKQKIWRSNFYTNGPLLELFLGMPPGDANVPVVRTVTTL